MGYPEELVSEYANRIRQAAQILGVPPRELAEAFRWRTPWHSGAYAEAIRRIFNTEPPA